MKTLYSFNVRNFKTAGDRRSAMEKELHIGLKHTGAYTLDSAVASARNCENMVGATQVPLGIAGPLRIHGTDHFLPLATTEGALVASVSRGCKAITESGGASVMSVRVGATRGPVFKVKSLAEQTKLFDFIASHTKEFDRIAKTSSAHITLTHVESHSVGLLHFVRFTFDTQDAMGLNMVTIASQLIADHIEKYTGARCVSLSGNYCVDKKPSWLNFTHGRGFEVWAEVTVPQHVLKNVLKTTAQNIYDVWLAKCMVGSAMSGSMGFNAQYANIVAALFIATGQDPAHVVEGSMGITTAEVKGKDVYISVYLPDLMVGTVGGGTGLATQLEALRLLGVAGGKNGKNSQKFAEIMAGAVLAGEVSLLASLGEGTLARAHTTLARGGK